MRAWRSRSGLLCCLCACACACAHAASGTSATTAPRSAPAAAPLPASRAFAWDREARRVAFAEAGGLFVREAASGARAQLAATPVAALAWSPDGALLVVARPTEPSGSQLQVIALDGHVVREASVAGMVSALAWGERAGIFAAAVELHSYRFGGQLHTLVYRWSESAQPTAVVSAETTVMPGVAQQLGTELTRSRQLALAPLEDELLYTRLITPPNVPAYDELVLRHLDSGAERSVARTALAPGFCSFSQDGETVLLCEPGEKCRQVDPWSGNASELGITPPTREVPFLQPRAELTPERAQRLLELRKLRDQALITPDDYREAKAKALAP